MTVSCPLVLRIWITQLEVDAFPEEDEDEIIDAAAKGEEE